MLEETFKVIKSTPLLREGLDEENSEGQADGG